MLVIEPTLGTMIEETELEAHADGGNPASLSAQRWTHSPDLLVMLTTGPALQILRQPSGVQAFRYLTRRYNPRTQARSMAKLQLIMHFDMGQDLAMVTDRLVAFERNGEGVRDLKRRGAGDTSHVCRTAGEMHTCGPRPD